MAANNIYPSKTESFIQKARNVHGEKYNYSLVNYKNAHTKITIICTEHGNFEQKPNDHLNGKGCPKCYNESRKLNRESFIERAKEIHGQDKYDYSLVNYKNNYTKITIICTEHGNFEQTPGNHLKGNGCPKCSNCAQRGIFNKKFLKYNPEKGKENCTFYIIQLTNNEESFIKCGITKRTILKRFSDLEFYDYEIVDSFETTLEDGINLESYFDKNFEKYWPRKRFCGYTECFQLEERENILQQVEF